jgi:hypothetical protein
MARTVSIKKKDGTLGKKLYVVGDVPRTKGDKFEATDVLVVGPTQERGCQFVSTPGGGTGFSCSRGPRYGGISAPVKRYVFDPEKHAIDGEES